MQQEDIDIGVFFIPGGEEASHLVYEQLVALIKTHEDLFLTVYRGFNRYDGTWSLVLIGEKRSCSQYQKQIQAPLSDVQAQPIEVPLESLAPLLMRFLATRAEMFQARETFVEKHHPLRKKPSEH